MPLTKKDLEDMMSRQKEERASEMEMLKQMLMEGVKEQIKEQVAAAKDEMKEELTTVKNELNDKVDGLEKKQSEVSDVQSVLDCRIDKLEDEMKTLKHAAKSKNNLESETNSDEADAEIAGLIELASKVIGFKPIERRDVVRMMRDPTKKNIEKEEEGMQECIREYLRCELRMPTAIVKELLENIEKVWHDDEEDWNKLYVQFKDVKSVKVCFSYCKFMKKDQETQLMQYIPPHFREQYRTLDTISYQLRKPEDTKAVKYKTRIRYGKRGLELEKRNPYHKNWTKVHVDHLPPVDLDPVPLPAARDSPPLVRTRQPKRQRSPPLNNSPTTQKKGKTGELETEELETDESEYSISNVEQSFQFKNLVDKFTSI